MTIRVRRRARRSSPPGCDPRPRRHWRLDHPRRDRAGHVPLPHPAHLRSWARFAPGSTSRPERPRAAAPLGTATATSGRSSARSRSRPRAPAPSWASAAGGWPAVAGCPGNGRGRPFHPGHHLAPAAPARVPLPRPGTGLHPPRYRPEPPRPQPHPPTRSPRLHRHPHTRRLTNPTRHGGLHSVTPGFRSPVPNLIFGLVTS
jgi:hypothetical protein